MTPKANAWFVKEKTLTDPRLRLFCFSYAGGSSRVFAGWQERFGDDLEVVAVETPGRGRRFGQALISDLKVLTNELSGAILPLLDRPFAFFGHSNGALLAYELTRSIKRNCLLLPRALFISGKRAPQMPRDERPLHGLPDDEFIEALKRYNGTPAEVLTNQELLQVFLPILRADFCLGETYRHELDEKLKVDVVLYGGKGDAIVPESDLLAWREVFDGEIEYQSFDGDHFFIHHSRDDVIASMKEKLAFCGERRLPYPRGDGVGNGSPAMRRLST